MSEHLSIVASRPQDLSSAAAQVVDKAEDAKIWLLEGPLGIGKTTFVQALCHHLGVREPVLSPTFSLVKEYSNAEGELFYHFDFYRLVHAHEIYDIGTEEYFASGSYCFVEWADKTPVDLIPPLHVRIRLSMQRRNARKLECLMAS